MALGALSNIAKIPELRRRLLFSLGMLAVYRVGVYVTVPGADRQAMQEFMGQDNSGSLLGMLNLFSGGALEQVSIFALGVAPYVSASIIFQLLSSIFKPLEELRKEGEMGQRKINQYTRYATIVLAMVQGFSIALYLEGRQTADLVDVVRNKGWDFRLMTMLSLATGTAFIMWLGEQITERGIGNGISLIIFAGIVAEFPQAIAQTWQFTSTGQITPVSLLLAAVLILGSVATIVFFERGQRRIPIEYSRRIIGRKMYGGQRTHLPLRVNSSGVIPPIFASTVLMLPATLANLRIPGMETARDAMERGDWVYNSLFIVLTVFFCYFYTSVTFPPVDLADNLKKQGAFIPMIRPGKDTADYIEKVLMRITFGGALYVAIICVLPDFMRQYLRVQFPFGGTSIMIVVGVALDTVNQIESYLISRHLEGFAGPGGPRIQGRRAV
ncbi:MAG: preprotein translocase subunit SecY [Myxococcaceae bacterium]|nr:MAG: preprotein translocase subunit SecY [Myxococcaceae bacterium]